MFGEESSRDKFEEFVTIINGKENTNSHLICVPSGANLPDALINTPIIQGEDGSGLPSGYAASTFAYGVNPEDDPELAMALRISMEEQRRTQEAEMTRPATGSDAASQQNPSATTGATGSNTATQPPSSGNEMDVSRMTEEEQIELAIRMSMTQAEHVQDVDMKEDTSSSSTAQTSTVSKPAEPENQKEDAFAALLTDPEFLTDVLRDLPGVDVNSEAVRAAIQQVQQQPQQKKDGKDKDSSNSEKK